MSTEFNQVKALVDANYAAFEVAANQQAQQGKPKVRAIWKVARPILQLIVTMPLIPRKWKAIISALLVSLDLLSNQEQTEEENDSESAQLLQSLSRTPTLLERLQMQQPGSLNTGESAEQLLNKNGQEPLKAAPSQEVTLPPATPAPTKKRRNRSKTK
jgi:hypothetical protein